ncbi:MAG: glycosyltransferase family 4 protein [Bacilli bacterium]|nr:glycosyltransferase family 4 protein [Bacilli bacterium]
MKILIVSQGYWPENFRISSIAEYLALLGHKVTVLTGLPNYPKGKIYDGYKSHENWTQNKNRVQIIRAKTIARRHGPFFRILNYWSFPHYASKLIKKLDNDFDVVLINELSPIMSAIPGLKYAKKYNKKVLMYEMDLWPESLLAGGISNKSLVYKHYKKVASKIYSSCDKILVSTKEHIQYIKNLPNCEELSIDYLPQCADPVFEENDFRTEENDFLDLVFAGNVGVSQSLETIIKAADIVKHDKRIKFHIVGSGSALKNVIELANELKLDNVVFYNNLEIQDMVNLYKLADGMLVTLENKSYANMTIPGKVQSYMAAGKPIIGAISGSCNSFIKDNEIGRVCEAEDYQSFADIILNLKKDELVKYGQNSKKMYFEKFNMKNFINTLVESLKDIIR